MGSGRTSQRGAALIMVMIVVVVLTLLVAGSIAFTGSERSAAIAQTRSETMSGCAQGARNLFLSNLRVLQGNATDVRLNQDLNGIKLETRHFTNWDRALEGIWWSPG